MGRGRSTMPPREHYGKKLTESAAAAAAAAVGWALVWGGPFPNVHTTYTFPCFLEFANQTTSQFLYLLFRKFDHYFTKTVAFPEPKEFLLPSLPGRAATEISLSSLSSTGRRRRTLESFPSHCCSPNHASPLPPPPPLIQ